MATLNSVVRGIRTIAEAHKQIRSFFYNVNIVEWLNEQKGRYPAVFLQTQPGIISPDGHATTIAFKMFFVDLANVDEATKANELDVESDMLSVAQDIVAQINRPGSDWYANGDYSYEVMTEGDNDMWAGVAIDFSLRIVFTQNICAVPTTFTDYNPEPTDEDMNVYDLEYIATGTEGTALTIPALAGKKLIFVSRESGVLYKVSNAPDTAEYTWDLTTITLGLATIAGARFLILYRNY